ncbi:hypothetical protein MYX65_09290 [Acidobacteria bacterium AH-259-L09]|nr:hypothetical protein [Acidobacteria bacterium AH-259-L09]
MNNKGKSTADGQLTGLAGEFFVAAELLKCGLQTSITFGNAKAIDLFTLNPRTGTCFTVQVKALRSKNYFPIKPDRVAREHIYVFVLLNKPGEAVQTSLCPGRFLSQKLTGLERTSSIPRFPAHTQRF